MSELSDGSGPADVSNFHRISDKLDEPLWGTAERIRRALREDLAECRLSREDLAVRLTVRMGRVSVALINAWVAESKVNRFPADLVPAWTQVTGSRRLLELLCGEAGLALATREDCEFAELGRTNLRGRKLTQKLWELI
jgi:hypothetical protein